MCSAFLIVRVELLYLAMVLLFVLQHFLQVQAAGQVALSQVVAELRNAEQALLCTHCFTVCTQEHTQREEGDKINTCEGQKPPFPSVLKCVTHSMYL